MENFIITFGQEHTHRCNNQTFDKDCVVVIKGVNHAEARETAFDLFGTKFATSYEEKYFDEGGLIKYFPRGKMKAN